MFQETKILFLGKILFAVYDWYIGHDCCMSNIKVVLRLRIDLMNIYKDFSWNG